ncbi:sodium:solute symporter [Campylobacter sp. 19-13652]|uniref:sodium:solute symporter family protein n=1 Tax=Campylobacter sp. 19-13652 TaxID=2840180 RepID=UPI001C783E72|nr:sodium:solute symporter family protein [Campylobacter sp. 19-13652]BCX80157.1 hypothetical protein LBC_16190 [Campylobacter sp. 19-13652]
MNIYLAGIFLGLLFYLAIGLWAGRRVKSLDDYYVSGRNATTLFIAGTMFASMLSTNGFMGDTAYAYSGNITTLFIINTLCACGYVIGPLYFGRYIRRAQVNTMPSYFRLRFNSRRIQILSGLIVTVSLGAYLLSVLQATGILMQSLTGLDRLSCLLISFAAILLFTLYSGSKGVILIDTAMCVCFLLSTIFVGYYVFENAGGLASLVERLTLNPNAPKDLLSYHGNTGEQSPFTTIIYGVTLGIVWLITVAVSPWQAGRNLIAKDEHTIFRSGIISAILTIYFLLFLYLIAIAMIEIYPNMPRPENVIIYAAYELAPKALGAFLLTGILSAGLSSATTFLSVVSFSIADDVLGIKLDSEAAQLKLTRLIILAVSVAVLVMAYFELASIRIIAWFASTIIAASWGYVAFASVWSGRLNERAAFYSMIGGFAGYLGAKAATAAGLFSLPAWLDAFFVGLAISVVLGVAFSGKQSKSERAFLKALHELPKSEQKGSEYRQDIRYGYAFIAAGVMIMLFLIIHWAIPYNKTLGRF